ncbi:sugar transferase [Chamaesiphon polymorphus]|uniref:Sugar transferase n=1 Tax=Chamaesiphon polymorphus CCALA 037 TaxID=2107692 RepID=A0A2T1GJU5_9CYAN|nr:sugar transferase [Chamaesiphon polymorphus]PSB58072.1 sugar transferase [Chamaesiphon polymorphus CCALA 037]
MFSYLSLPEIKLSLEFSERKLLLALVDVLLIFSGIIGSLWYWSYRADRAFGLEPIGSHLLWIVGMGVGWLVWMFVNDLYDLRIAVKLKRTIERIGWGCAIVGIIYLIYYFVTAPLQEESLSLRLAPAIAIASTSVLLSIWRTIYALFLGVGHASQRVLIFGAGVTGTIIADVFRQHPHYKAIGFIDDNTQLHGKVCQNIPILGDRRSLEFDIDSDRVDEIVLAISRPIDEDLLQLLTAFHERGVAITPMPVLYEKLTGKVAVEHIGSQWYSALPLKKNPFDTFNRIGKRILDLICGAIIGTVLAIVFPFVATAIRLDSPGPIFYKQERVGQYGNKFTVYKFRSMVQDAERNGKAQWAVKGDARITKVGNFIRKTRLDELPQVLNVLRGEMSMVGPRPERYQFIKELQQQLPFYRTRLAVKPGLTGWAQINYGYGSTIEDALIKLQYDLYYIKHRSPWLDLKILLRTFSVVLKMQGQ